MEPRENRLKDEARRGDEEDPLSSFRERFHHPPGTIYMNGNSLGLMSREAEQSLEEMAQQWKELAIRGWTGAPEPWLSVGERLGDKMRPLVGAEPREVVVTGTTTVNIHALLASFYRPRGRRVKILATELDFPSDIYALEGQLRLLHGPGGERHLIKAPSRDGWTVREEDIIDLMTGEVALVFLPSVHYVSGQLMDMERLAGEARSREITVGFDLSHSVGILPHRLSEWGVDFALWCGYKWLNGGPGAAAGLYVNWRHRGLRPLLSGWWGSEKEKQFEMRHEFEPAPGAGAFQISTPAMLSMAPVEGALRVITEAGIEKIREKSLALTGYMMKLSDELLQPRGFTVVTPRQRDQRGGHVALRHARAREITAEMGRRGLVADFRPPEVIRVAPSPLYSSFGDVYRSAVIMASIAEQMEHQG